MQVDTNEINVLDHSSLVYCCIWFVFITSTDWIKMLGWSFTVREVNTNERIYHWEGDLFSDKWLQNAMANQDAMKTVSNGGYPDLYLVKTRILEETKGIMQTTAKWVYVEVWDQS